LQLQSLPAPASILGVNTTLMADNVPTVLVHKWPVTVPWFERDTGLKGPVPVIFTEELEATKGAISADVDSFKKEMTKVYDR